jgi:hypothetical protein
MWGGNLFLIVILIDILKIGFFKDNISFLMLMIIKKHQGSKTFKSIHKIITDKLQHHNRVSEITYAKC